MNLSQLNPLRFAAHLAGQALTLAERLTGRKIGESTRHFFKDSLFYSIANFLPRFMGLAVWPLQSMLVRPDGYIIANNFLSAITVICVLISWQIELSVARYYYDRKPDFPEFVGTQFFFTTAVSVVMLIQFWFLRHLWADWFRIPPLVLLLAVVTAMAQIVHQLYNQLLLARKESNRFLTFSLAKQTLYVASVVGLLTWMALSRAVLPSERYLALVWAQLIPTVVLALVFLRDVMRSMRPAFKMEHLRYALGLTLPAVPGALALCGLNYFDRIFISHKDATLAGQYAFAYNLGFMIQLISSGVFSAYMPRFYESRREDDYGQIQRLFSRNFKLLLLAGAGLIIIGKPLGMILAKKDYLACLSIIPIVVTSYIFMYLGQCYGLYIAFRRKFIFMQSLSQIVAVAANILLIVWLVPRFNYDPHLVALNTLIPLVLQWLIVYAVARFMLKEKTVTFQGAGWAFVVFLVLAAGWVFVGY